MVLKFPNHWRAQAPDPKGLPKAAVEEFVGLAHKVATQGSKQGILEKFKSATAAAAGVGDHRSSNEQWAASDLERNFEAAANNPPVFIECFMDACAYLHNRNPDWWMPDEHLINLLLRKHGVPYEVSGQALTYVQNGAPSIPVPPAPPSIAETAISVYNKSLERSEQLLIEGRPREAVQELLWLLETLSTAFRGLETESGTVAGKYFNQITKDLRAKQAGKTLERVLDWLATLHGYLSAPGGGGVRHGLDLNTGVQITMNEGRLYCNLIRSYLSYLLSEHSRLTDSRSGNP